jgi:alginate O-acetyltransferase complex protein AlgI
MIFGDLTFFAILAGCWLTFHAVPIRARPTVLASWGVLFYAVYAWQALPLVLGLTVAAWVAGTQGRTWPFIGAVLIVFAAFKSGTDAGRWLLIGPGPAGTAPIVPLGLSFLAFELMHLVIERGRGRVPSVPFADVAAFAFYFPCRVAGPLRRYPAFAASVAEARASFDNVYAGAVRVAIGFLKKFLIADVLASTVAEMSYAATPWHVWKVTIAFGLQLYFDFSAYSDIAIGVSRTLGIHVPENFRSPYLSANIRDFWTRWHITLASWVRDYVFTPVGRELFRTRMKASPVSIAALSYLAAFLVVGAWHGLAANFIVWGLYHGALLSGHHLYLTKAPPAMFASELYRSRAMTGVSTVATFLLVTIGWVPFMTDLPNAMRLLSIMLGRP